MVEGYEDDHRYATQRARLLARTTNLRKPEAKAIAYAERGYSHSGVSKHIDASENTVVDYFERAMAYYGMEITETLLPDEDVPEYEPVEPGYHRTLHKEDQKKWVKFVDRHREKLPQEWVNEVLSAAKKDGANPIKTTNG